MASQKLQILDQNHFQVLWNSEETILIDEVTINITFW